MKYVIDSSVAFERLVSERDSDKALRFEDEYVAGLHDLIAPDVFPVEIAHSLTRAGRQGRIAVSESVRLLRVLLRTLPDLHPSLPLLPLACGILSAAQIGVYDCLYVALAEREGCEFVTADDRLVRNLQARFPFIVSLSTLP